MTQQTIPDRPSVSLLAFGVALVALSACDGASRKDPKAMSSAELSQELERCKALGLEASKDSACEAANKETFERFMGRSKEPGR